MKIVNRTALFADHALLFFTASVSQAQSLVGDTFNITAYYPDSESAFFDLGTETIVDGQPAIFSDQNPYYFSIDDNSISFIGTDESSFANTSFNGFVITDLSHAFTATLTSDTTSSGVDPTKIVFGGNTISINFAAVAFTAGNELVFSTAQIIPPVPEPETYEMLAAGLGLMALIGKRRKPAGGFSRYL